MKPLNICYEKLRSISFFLLVCPFNEGDNFQDLGLLSHRERQVLELQLTASYEKSDEVGFGEFAIFYISEFPHNVCSAKALVITNLTKEAP